MPVKIDPQTGEVVQGAIQIDPKTGEVVSFATPPSVSTMPELRSMTAAPPRGVTGYLQDISRDLSEGGSRTAVGRALGTLQGRGEKGYSGLQSGTTSETASYMGSVPLGITKVATGVSEVPQHPLTGLKDIVGGALQTAEIPSTFAAPGTAKSAMEAIPSAKYAGWQLGEIERAAAAKPGGVQVVPQGTMPALQRFQQIAERGGQQSRPITSLGTRLKDIVQTPSGKSQPLEFKEARDYYGNLADSLRRTLGNLISGESLSGRSRGAAKAVKSGLSQDIAKAAEQIGMGKQYRDAMKEYAQAKALGTALKAGAAATAMRYLPTGIKQMVKSWTPAQ